MRPRQDVLRMLAAAPVAPHVARPAPFSGPVPPLRPPAPGLPAVGRGTRVVTFPSGSPNSQKTPSSVTSSVSVAPSSAGRGKGGVTGGAGQGGKTLGYLLMKCQEILKKSDRPLHTRELQLCLACDRNIQDDHEFLAFLRDNPRIFFDSTTKQWSYRSPFDHITSAEALKNVIRDKTECLNGLEITPDLLGHHPQMIEWTKQLLTKREIRAIRATRNVRCKNYAPNSGIQCDLYEADKCEACNSMKGITLYALEGDHVEGSTLDEDIKTLWLDTTMPAMDILLEENQLSCKRGTTDGEKKKRRRPSSMRSGRGGRISKILNTHIYSADDFKQELQANDEKM